jgi:hypothetical protein
VSLTQQAYKPAQAIFPNAWFSGTTNISVRIRDAKKDEGLVEGEKREGVDVAINPSSPLLTSSF